MGGDPTMANTTPLLDSLLAGWQEYQENLVQTVRPLTSEQLALSAAPHLRTAREIVVHIADARANWFFNILHEGGDAMGEISQWGRSDASELDAAALARGLEATWGAMLDTLARWTSADLTAPIVLREPAEKWTITRAWVIWHLLEHDLHHGGELAHTLGVHHVPVRLPPPPPDKD